MNWDVKYFEGVFYYELEGRYYPIPLPIAVGTSGRGGRRIIPGPPTPNINIYNSDGTLTSVRTLNMDGRELTFTDGTKRSVEFLRRALFDHLNNLVLDWRNQQLLRPDGTLSADWAQSWLTDNNTNPTPFSQLVSVAWVDRILYSSESALPYLVPTQIASVQWATRELIDRLAFTTLNWQSTELHARPTLLSPNSLAVLWDLRQLHNSPDGVVLDWENKQLFFVWDATGGFKIGSGDTITKVITATDTLDFPDTLPQTSSDLPIALPGAVDGDVVSLGVPSSSVLPDSSYTAFVSAPNVVTVRFNNYSAGNQDPSSGDFRVMITQF